MMVKKDVSGFVTRVKECELGSDCATCDVFEVPEQADLHFSNFFNSTYLIVGTKCIHKSILGILQSKYQ